MGKKRPHSHGLDALHRWFVETFGWEYVQREVPIDVAPEDNPTNEPEPDLIVLNRPSTDFRIHNPQPGDIRLVAEVSDSPVLFDRTVIARLYARACLAEYWVLDVKRRLLIGHREPRDGEYASIAAYSDHEFITPLAAPPSS